MGAVDLAPWPAAIEEVYDPIDLGIRHDGSSREARTTRCLRSLKQEARDQKEQGTQEEEGEERSLIEDLKRHARSNLTSQSS